MLRKPQVSSPGELVKIKADIQKVLSLQLLLNHPPSSGQSSSSQNQVTLVQAEHVRKLKDSTTSQGTLATRAEVLKEVSHLLELKVLDPDVFDTEPKLFEAKVLKIRWYVPDSQNGNTRVQFRFPNITSISGSQIWETIQSETSRKYRSLNNVVSIQKREAEDKKDFVEMSKEERFILPLVFPGPLFKSEHAFEFKVTWDGTPPPPKARPKVFID